MTDKEFITTFNEFYPFERYILKTPVVITDYFDDVKLTEIFIPDTEIKLLSNGLFTKIDEDEIYVKVKCKEVEMCFAFYDFSSRLRKDIAHYILEDFKEWESLYIEQEDDSDLKEALLIQKELIISKYGKCNIKNSFTLTDTIKLINE